MNMRWFLLFVSLVSAGTFAKIDPLQWNVIEERGGENIQSIIIMVIR